MTNTALAFAVVLPTILVGHEIADHVFGQTDAEAKHKANRSWDGVRHNLSHVAKYHVVIGLMAVIVSYLLNVETNAMGWVAGLGFSAVTHGILDRRWPVAWILRSTGSPEFAKPGGPLPGMYLADQSLHKFCLWIAALLIVAL